MAAAGPAQQAEGSDGRRKAVMADGRYQRESGGMDGRWLARIRENGRQGRKAEVESEIQSFN